MNHEPEYQSSGLSPGPADATPTVVNDAHIGVPARAAAVVRQIAPRSATPTDAAKYMTPADVADLLQVSIKTVSRMSLQDSSMPCFRRGRVVRFPRAQLLAWLDRRS